MKLTEFGKFSRKLRIENGELLKTMAEKLGVTSSYLSAVEIGKRNIPKTWEEKIVRAYNLDEENLIELRHSMEHSRKVIEINVENYDKDEKDIVLMLARRMDNLNEKEKEDLKKILFK
ncbi:helix-turn-helix domain-containing protein [Paraclostridium sordellii]|uniref:helix-turn-helix domain-containing protein n=1 Tax=Paraclostridium sordellii TaxID=1505 RepID=UPI0022E3E9F9|nr:helix-turn-helix transcriptional regulator [Paeniclostridium sordellii]